LVPDIDMVRIDCPFCNEAVDLGSANASLYECPYCSEEFEYISKDELIVSVKTTSKNTGTLVNHGVFKGWRAFGPPSKKKSPPANWEKSSMFDTILFSILLCLGLAVVLWLTKISNGICLIALTAPILIAMSAVVEYFNDLMIKKGWLFLARCKGQYALWDGQNTFAIPLAHNRNLFISSETIFEIIVHRGPGIYTNNKYGLVHIFTRGKNGHVNFTTSQDEQDFLNILIQVTGVIPKTKYHKKQRESENHS
tara:strand:+ start:2363 stop:3118 length:756 start_codon:yes stop_codon:yes gene_type:complete